MQPYTLHILKGPLSIHRKSRGHLSISQLCSLYNLLLATIRLDTVNDNSKKNDYNTVKISSRTKSSVNTKLSRLGLGATVGKKNNMRNNKNGAE